MHWISTESWHLLGWQLALSDITALVCLHLCLDVCLWLSLGCCCWVSVLLWWCITTTDRLMALYPGQPGWAGTRKTFIYSHPAFAVITSVISFIDFLHFLWYVASALYSCWPWQSFSAATLQVFFGLPLGLAPSTSYSMQSHWDIVILS